MKLYEWTDRQVFRLSPASEFLKAYSTNTLDRPFNAFVDIKGRIVATFYQIILPGDEALLVIGKAFAARVSAHLSRYLDLTGAVLQAESRHVYFDLEKGEVKAVSEKLPTAVSEEEFRLYRLKNRLPLQGVDYDEELLLNVHDEECISYTKGCYLGQEIIARVHYRSQPPKKLTVKTLESCIPEEAARLTSRAMDPATGQTLGFGFV